MLVLRRITVDNFGPFKGQQAIDFPADPGVVVIYGENMRGKTTLLNAIRYAFFGYVTGRAEHHIDLARIGNWEAASEGTFGFRVVLHFDYDGNSYELSRQCRPRQGVSVPAGTPDYVQETLLRRGADVLGPEQRDLMLTQILPERVSRFFLFDGELLQQYEELLREESTMGRQIKEAIERILGVPVLTNARTDLRGLLKDAQTQEAKAAQRDQRTRELGNLQQGLTDQRTHQEAELERLKSEMEGLRLQRKGAEDALRRSERMRALLSERDALVRAIEDLDQKIADKRTKVRSHMAQVWRWLLNPRIEQACGSMDARIEEMQNRQTERAVATSTLALVEQALVRGVCESCGRPLDPALLAAFRQRADALRSLAQSDGNPAELAALLQRRATLRDFLLPERTDLLEELMLAVDDLRVERATKTDRLEEIREQTHNLDESEIRRLTSEYDKIVEQLTIVDTGIKTQTAKVQELNENIKRVQDQLDRVGGADITKERRRRELCDGLLQLFERAVAEYRDELRAKVEADATALFVRLTTEGDYKGLSINENYGLTIVHRDGNAIPVRSAGAEHIVALSLMGALQLNAPLRGPIIMDSPFGRLDQGHTTRVVRALPGMADQVLLLVYEAEMERGLARRELGAQLRREYQIVRKSARHSTLQPLTE
jgi:DNA sulfur modification protein DndD